MANGSLITRSIGFAIVRYGSFFTVDEVVLASPGDLSSGRANAGRFNARVDRIKRSSSPARPRCRRRRTDRGLNGVLVCDCSADWTLSIWLLFPADIGDRRMCIVKRERKEAKFWIDPLVELEFNSRFAAHELNVMRGSFRRIASI